MNFDVLKFKTIGKVTFEEDNEGEFMNIEFVDGSLLVIYKECSHCEVDFNYFKPDSDIGESLKKE